MLTYVQTLMKLRKPPLFCNHHELSFGRSQSPCSVCKARPVDHTCGWNSSSCGPFIVTSKSVRLSLGKSDLSLFFVRIVSLNSLSRDAVESGWTTTDVLLRGGSPFLVTKQISERSEIRWYIVVTLQPCFRVRHQGVHKTKRDLYVCMYVSNGWAIKLAPAPRPSTIYCATPTASPSSILHSGWNVGP
jgi:hypothetical protein